MNRNAAVIALVMLAVSFSAAPPARGQAGAPKSSTPAQYVREEEETLKFYTGKAYTGLANSERGSRWSARNYPMSRPTYPAAALADGTQGTVTLSFFIYRGKASLIKVVDSPHASLNRAAIEAVRQWRWLPFDVEGKPFPTLTRLTFDFVIKDGAGRVDDPEDMDTPELKDWWRPIDLRERAVWPEDVTSP